MNKENTEQLITASPKFLSKTKYFGFHDGWFNLVFRLFRTIEHYINSLPSEEQDAFFAVQCKEKFGGLRVYYNKSDPFIEGAIAMAESMSRVICEKCGSPGTIQGEGWVRCLCNTCNNKK